MTKKSDRQKHNIKASTKAHIKGLLASPKTQRVLAYCREAAAYVLWFFDCAIRFLLARKRGIVESILALMTIVAFAYLIADSIYQMEVTVSSPASEPKDPYYFPFTITNNSHIFPIRNIRWTCNIAAMKDDRGNFWGDNKILHGTKSEIARGGALNIFCRGFPVAGHALEGVVYVDVEYDTDIFGWFTLPRHPAVTRFTWMGAGDNPQWIRGEFAE